MQASADTGSSGDWFKPTLGRLLFAAALAIAGFWLPQEIPLEWYPLNNPGQDILYLEIACAADKTGEVQIFYDATKGMNEHESIRWPISPTTQTYTYTFPLPDAPITELRLDPVAEGGALTVRQLRIIDRRGTEVRRFTKDDIVPLQQIAGITPIAEGWKIISEPSANDPYARIQLDAPILAKGINHRNFLRCLYSGSYLALMLWILLLAVLFVFYRPRGWRELLAHLGFMAALALMFSAVGNRGLIKNSVRYARFVPPVVAPGVELEVYLSIDHPQAAQLFWDLGRGINEADSLRSDYERHDGLQTLRFPLPATPLKGLRFDPLDGEAQLVIRGLRVVDAAHHALAVLPLASLEATQDIERLTLENDNLKIDTQPGRKDPILLFSPQALSAINHVLAARPKP